MRFSGCNGVQMHDADLNCVVDAASDCCRVPMLRAARLSDSLEAAGSHSAKRPFPENSGAKIFASRQQGIACVCDVHHRRP